jgi:uncharacterized heparinase superfamily protein
MKAILEIPEKDVRVELNNLIYSQFRMIGRKPHAEIPLIFEKYPIGKPIILITSNMPDVLKEAIDEMISQYCEH